MSNISTKSGFFQQFFTFLKDCKTNIEAYEKTEELYKAKHNRKLYASYDSFRKAKYRYLKKG